MSYTKLNLNTWNRKQHFEHFSKLQDPYFGLVTNVNVTKAYQTAKTQNVTFFTKYLHACMVAINSVKNLKYRIINNEVVIFDVIHASATMLRANNTFGFSFIHFEDNINAFHKNVMAEKERILNSEALFPPINGLDCIHCSALPWVNFTSHKEPVSGALESIPKLAFSKIETQNNEITMNVAINVNHALVDGYHLGQFFKIFQNQLNN